MQRRTTRIAAFVLVLGALAVRAAEEPQLNYWSQIKEHMAEVNKAPFHGAPGAEAFVAYMDSLSAEQMILAGRQASAEVGTRFPADQWPMASMSLAFFYQYYPLKSDNLREIGPLLTETEDANQPPFWRWFLSDMLTRSWDREGRLSDEQRRQVSETLMRISQQPDAPASVLAEATRGVPRLLASMQKALPPLKEGEGPGEARQRLSAVSQEYAKTAALLLARKGMSTEVQREAVAGLVRTKQMSLAGGEVATTAIAAAARDYARYAEELWPQLMLGAFRTGATVDLDSLLSRQQEAAKQKETAERLQTVRAVAALPEAPSSRSSAAAAETQPVLRRLSECSEGELLTMASGYADALAGNLVSERTWARLSAIVAEYKKRG